MTPVVQISQQDGVTVARVDGEIDLANATEVTRGILGGVAGTAVAVVVDLSSVRYVDSAGVRALFEVARRIGESRRELRLVLPERSPVRRLVHLTNLDGVAPVLGSLDEAIGDLDALPGDRSP